MKCIYNFTFTEETMVSVLLPNRAFQYGDGLFETIIYRNGQALFLPDHFERLLTGLQVLCMQLSNDFTFSYLQEVIHQLVQVNHLQETARIRLQVWRKAGGLYTPSEAEAEFYISIQPFSPAPAVKEKVLFYEDIRLSFSVISALKTCNALPYIMAGIARKESSVDDMILLDTDGHISECIASNIFWMKEDCLFTPSLQSGCIAGVMRKQVIYKAKQLGIPVKEGLFRVAEILSAYTVFCSNVAGSQIINQIQDVVFDAEKLPESLLNIGQ